MNTPINNGILQSNLDLNGFILTGLGEGSTPGGADTQLQVNQSGALGGIPEVTYDGSLPLKITTAAATNVTTPGLQLRNTGSSGNRISPEIHLIRYGTGEVDGVGKFDTKIWGEGGDLRIATQFNDGGYNHTGIRITEAGTITQFQGDTTIVLAALYGLDYVSTGGDATHPQYAAISNSNSLTNTGCLALDSLGTIWWDAGNRWSNVEGDTMLNRTAAGVMKLKKVLELTPVAVSSLPTGVLGRMAVVNDGTASLAWGATVTGGGSTKYLVWYNGTNWTVFGK